MFEQLLSRLASTGFRRSRSGSRVWLVVASVAAGLRLLRYVSRNGEHEILYRTQVMPGDQFEIITKAPNKR
jgi:hypothetical protein